MTALHKLAAEYRKSMDPEILHSWAADVVEAIAELPKATADSDGWIEWKGGECPVDGGVRVEYRMWDGSTDPDPCLASRLRWTSIGSPGDIIAYRVVSQ